VELISLKTSPRSLKRERKHKESKKILQRRDLKAIAIIVVKLATKLEIVGLQRRARKKI